MAAIGFETTAPAYALMLETAIEMGIGNLKLLTAIKRLIPALEALCMDSSIDAFIAPGHVAAIIGGDIFKPLAARFCKPFAIAGFTPKNMLMALYYLVRQIEEGRSGVKNLYGEVVRPEGNIRALAAIDKYFEPAAAFWRGLCVIEGSGFYLKERYAMFDAGSRDLSDSENDSKGCLCAQVLTGRADPDKCPLFAETCTPENAFGPCMVSAEGACGIWYQGV
jgi:hydrogenase expression/formation protein HypD